MRKEHTIITLTIALGWPFAQIQQLKFSFSSTEYKLSISKNHNSGQRGLLVPVRYHHSYFQLLYLQQPGRFTTQSFQTNCLRQWTCHSWSVPRLLCLTKGHSVTEVHIHQADLPQEEPGMNYKISQVPTELYQLQAGIFQELFNSLLLTHNLLFGLRHCILGKQIPYSVINQTLSLCW